MLKVVKLVALVSTFAALVMPVRATVVEFQTVLGDFQVNLFDETTPQTVQNFLDYVNSGAYANNVVHRSQPGFVIQGGGFTYNGSFPLDEVVTGPAVENEPELSNVRGTIAMAKLSNQPDSATSQWFINLDNNSSNLDLQNAGFSVFGQVLGDGMQIVDAIAALDRFDFGGALATLPLRDFTSGQNVTEDNLVIITDIVVIDDAINTNPDLEPVPNTLINQQTPPATDAPESGGDSGGSMNMGLLVSVSLLALFRRRKANQLNPV